jgi:small GTP-binding protein
METVEDSRGDFVPVSLVTPRGSAETSKPVTFRSFKVLVVGEPGVGKSSFIDRYVKNIFNPARKSTVGVDFIPYNFHWDATTEVSLHFWDIPGQQRLEDQQAMFYRDARACLVMYDCMKQCTLTAARKWKKGVDKHCMLNGHPYKPPCVLIANKIDLACDNSADFNTYGLDLVVKEEKFRCGFPISNLNSYNVPQVVRKLVEILLEEEKILSAAGFLTAEKDDAVIDLGVLAEEESKPTKKCTC